MRASLMQVAQRDNLELASMAFAWREGLE